VARGIPKRTGAMCPHLEREDRPRLPRSSEAVHDPMLGGACSKHRLLLESKDIYGKAVTEYRVSMVDLANVAYSWKLSFSRGPGGSSGTHLVHDSHAARPLFFSYEHVL
jgi:hypothetical protein